MANKRAVVENVDPALLSRIAQLSPGSQRWLKTAIVTMRTMPARAEDSEPDVEVPPQLRRRLPQVEKEPERHPPDMEDIITGKVDIKELDKYPELAEQMEGMGEVIDMLRGLGESRRKRGEQILREEILGEERQPTEDDEDFNF
ncbi:MAG: hypothetical protein ABI559_06020 [Chloroflexota bacterium]